MSVTAAQVAAWSKFPLPDSEEEPDALALLELVVAAVTEHIETVYVTSDPFTDTQDLACIMQAARVWRRRDTPEGIIAFDELGAVRITRLDQDVAAMLSTKIVFS